MKARSSPLLDPLLIFLSPLDHLVTSTMYERSWYLGYAFIGILLIKVTKVRSYNSACNVVQKGRVSKRGMIR